VAIAVSTANRCNQRLFFTSQFLFIYLIKKAKTAST
jgi:hypothetical protein